MMEGTNTAANKVANTAGLAGLRDKLNLKLGAYNEAVKIIKLLPKRFKKHFSRLRKNIYKF